MVNGIVHFSILDIGEALVQALKLVAFSHVPLSVLESQVHFRRHPVKQAENPKEDPLLGHHPAKEIAVRPLASEEISPKQRQVGVHQNFNKERVVRHMFTGTHHFGVRFIDPFHTLKGTGFIPRVIPWWATDTSDFFFGNSTHIDMGK